MKFSYTVRCLEELQRAFCIVFFEGRQRNRMAVSLSHPNLRGSGGAKTAAPSRAEQPMRRAIGSRESNVSIVGLRLKGNPVPPTSYTIVTSGAAPIWLEQHLRLSEVEEVRLTPPPFLQNAVRDGSSNPLAWCADGQSSLSDLSPGDPSGEVSDNTSHPLTDPSSKRYVPQTDLQPVDSDVFLSPKTTPLTSDVPFSGGEVAGDEQTPPLLTLDPSATSHGEVQGFRRLSSTTVVDGSSRRNRITRSSWLHVESESDGGSDDGTHRQRRGTLPIRKRHSDDVAETEQAQRDAELHHTGRMMAQLAAASPRLSTESSNAIPASSRLRSAALEVIKSTGNNQTHHQQHLPSTSSFSGSSNLEKRKTFIDIVADVLRFRRASSYGGSRGPIDGDDVPQIAVDDRPVQDSPPRTLHTRNEPYPCGRRRSDEITSNGELMSGSGDELSPVTQTNAAAAATGNEHSKLPSRLSAHGGRSRRPSIATLRAMDYDAVQAELAAAAAQCDVDPDNEHSITPTSPSAVLNAKCAPSHSFQTHGPHLIRVETVATRELLPEVDEASLQLLRQNMGVVNVACRNAKSEGRLCGSCGGCSRRGLLVLLAVVMVSAGVAAVVIGVLLGRKSS